MKQLAYRLAAFLCIGLLMSAAGASIAQAGPQNQRIRIQPGQFDPAEITIPADTRVKVLVSNENAGPAEFEGYDFPTEKVIPGKTELPVYLGPLDAGTYKFFNEFEQGVTGTLIVE